ncbi:MAG: 30S ribosomal protein THX [Olleya sp.]
MGKGDKKSRRGKINSGTFGVRRPRIKKRVRPETKISVDKKTKVKP